METTMKNDFKEYIIYILLVAWDFIKRFAIRFASQLICLVLGIAIGVLCARTHYVKKIETIESKHIEAQMMAEQEAEAEATAGQIWSAQNEDYMALARMIGGVRERYNLSEDACRALIDVCQNRMNAHFDVFANDNTLKEVALHEGQFENVLPENMYTQTDFQIVKDYLESNSGRVLNSDKLFWVQIGNGYVLAMDYDALTTGKGTSQKIQ